MDKKGYYTKTQRIRLFCDNPEWVKITIKLYNEILSFYYNYLLSHLDLLALTNYNLLREIEIRTVGEKRSNRASDEMLPFPKTPLYFRRSVINTAIRMIRSYETQLRQWEETKENPKPKPEESFQTSPVFYKGMYRNFKEENIELKLWNGEKWFWVLCKFRKQNWDSKKVLSPTLKLYGKKIMLHVPIVSPVDDIRPLEKRKKEDDRFCAISFPNNDNGCFSNYGSRRKLFRQLFCKR